MTIYNQTFVYWIHLPEHTDIYSQGYVGVSNNPKRRLSEHKLASKNGYKDNPFLGRILQKYEVIQTIIFCGNDTECYAKEETLRPVKNIGWNINKGGSKPPSMTGIPRTSSTKQKISNSLRGHIVTTSTRDKISTSSEGRIITEKTKQKISKSLSGKSRPNEVKNKISKSKKGLKGISPSAETRDKLSNALKNRQFSDETRAKISAAKKEYWAIKRAQGS
jgi:hypothetical protein